MLFLDMSTNDFISYFIRSVQMRLYAMHKREFGLVFLAFFACFGMCVFIGLAGRVGLIDFGILTLMLNVLNRTPYHVHHTPEYIPGQWSSKRERYGYWAVLSRYSYANVLPPTVLGDCSNSDRK